MRFTALALSVLTALSVTVASAGENDGFRLQNAYIHLDKYEYGSNVSGDLNEMPNATVKIIEINDNTLAKREIEIPVVIRTQDKGINLKFMYDEYANFNLIHLDGKKIGDIFGRYTGGIASVGLIANVGAFTAKNSKGVVITDGEQIAAASLGVKIAKRNLIIAPLGTLDGNVKVSVSNSGSQQVEHVSVSLGDLMTHEISK